MNKMDTFRRILLITFGVIFSIGLSILVCINGWGLVPQSWGWIIGIGFSGQVLAQIIIEVGKAKN